MSTVYTLSIIVALFTSQSGTHFIAYWLIGPSTVVYHFRWSTSRNSWRYNCCCKAFQGKKL